MKIATARVIVKFQVFVLIGAIGFASRSSATAPDLNAPIGIISGIPAKIGSCWQPPHTDDEITIRLSFTRDGILIGRPRVTFMKVSGKSDTGAKVDLANSILRAVYNCTPLQFTPEFGASIAGRVLALRFTAPRPPARSAGLRVLEASL